jgi:hypothetical protein
MKYAARLLLPVLISLGLQSGVVSQVVQTETAPSSYVAVDRPVLVIVEPIPLENSTTGGTDQQQELLAWALEQYETAGLELPVLQIHLHSDPAACKGNQGLFSSGSTPWKITLCTEERMVYLHEIGHSWSELNLTEAERAEYVEQRGMESWNDPETPWRARGSEDAANTLAWGLVDDPISEMIPGGPLAQKNDAFRLLTGSDSPRIVTG